MLAGDSVPAEIVVVDQSDERDERLAAHPHVTYVSTAVRGASAARNEGIRAAQHDLLVFVDDDVLVAPEWLATLVPALETAGDGAVVSGQVREGEGPGSFAPSLTHAEQRAVYRGRAAANVLWTGNMAIFRTTVERIGFFDERLGPGRRRFPGGGEDNDYCFRLLEAGLSIVYEPGAVVYHRAWRAPEDYVGVRWRYGRGQGGFYGKHVQLRDTYILRQLVRHVASCCGDAVRELRHDRRLAAGSAAYAAGIATAAAEWVLTERLAGALRRRHA